MSISSSSGSTSLSATTSPVLSVRLQRDDPLAAALLHAVLVDRRALAHAPLDVTTSSVASRLMTTIPITLIARSELDALHAGRVAPHLAHVLSWKRIDSPWRRREHDVVRAARHLHVDQLVAVLDLDRLDARRARVRVLRQRGLLHRALLASRRAGTRRRANSRTGTIAGTLRVRRHVDQVDDRLALRRAPRLRDLVHLEPEAAPVVGEERGCSRA